MDRSLQLQQVFELRHRNGMKVKDALATVGLVDSTFYSIPQEERDAAEKEVIDKLATEYNETDGALKTARHEAEYKIVETILARMPEYIDELDNLAHNARREDVRKAAIDTLIDIARQGVFLPTIQAQPRPTEDQLPEPDKSRMLAPPSTMVQPTVIIFTPGEPKDTSRPADVVDGEIVQR